MPNLFARSLMNKLVLAFVLAALVPMAVVGYWSYSSGKATLGEHARIEMEAIADAREAAIIAYLSRVRARVMDFSSDSRLRDDLEKMSARPAEAAQIGRELGEYLKLDKMPLTSNGYEMQVLDLTGKVVASTNGASIGKDKSEEPCFASTAARGAHIEDLFMSEATGKPTLLTASPIQSWPAKKELGVLVYLLDTVALNAVTTDDTGMGQTGEVYIVNRDGLMITDSRHVKEAAFKQKVNTPPVRLMLDEQKTMVGTYTGYRGTRVFGASRGDGIDKAYGLPWVLIATIEEGEAVAPSRALGMQVVWAGLVMAILAALFALFMARGISLPIRNTAAQTARIAQGDLTAPMSGAKRADEIGLLTDSFGRMVSSLSQQTRDITQAVNVLATSATEISATVSQLAAGSAETAASVTQTTATIEELKQTADLSAQKAREVSDSALRTAQVSQTGEAAVAAASESMRGIRDQMEAVAESVVKLSEQSQAIGQIVATVDDLAEQSNLLSVNAAIEAAKAGEQGKGFGVVAQEVKNLAEQSKQATAQIRGILNDIQKATSGAVMATEQAGKAVALGEGQSVKAGEAIQTLAQSIREASQAAAQIAASSRQQLTGVEQVTTAMESIKEASNQYVTGTQQLESAARNIDDLGKRLQGLVAHYKV